MRLSAAVEARREPGAVASPVDLVHTTAAAERRRRIRLALLAWRRSCSWRRPVPRETDGVLCIAEYHLVDVATLRAANHRTHGYTLPSAAVAAASPAL